MDNPGISGLRLIAENIFRAGIDAVRPERLMPAWLESGPGWLRIGEERFPSRSQQRLWVLGAGKAAASMAREAERILGDQITGGLVIVKKGYELPLERIGCLEGGHPLPDAGSLEATAVLLGLLKRIKPGDLILFLLSGGASSLMTDLPKGISLEDLSATIRLLQARGTPIAEINTIRKHLSRIKGGQLLGLAPGREFRTLALSDVIGDRADIIGSGPTVSDPDTFTDAWELVYRYRLESSLPESVRHYLQEGMAGRIPETLKSGDPLEGYSRFYLIGTNQLALDAAASQARKSGFQPILLGRDWSGEASLAGRHWARLAASYPRGRRICLLAAGETTVTLKGSGKGGRSQEFVLAALQELGPHSGLTILSGGTDGSDGPTGVAGALCDDQSHELALSLKLDLQQYLNRNDSYHFFDQIGGQILTGPSGTNVMDLMVALIS